LSQTYENYVLAFFGAFVAILGAGGISYAFKNVQGFQGDTPLAIGSLGATAVLLYVVPESPLSQPRSVIGGHMVSALSGVVVGLLFTLGTTCVKVSLTSGSSFPDLATFRSQFSIRRPSHRRQHYRTAKFLVSLDASRLRFSGCYRYLWNASNENSSSS